MSSLFRRILGMVVLVLIGSLLLGLLISLFPIFLVIIVFLLIYSFLFGSRHYYVYRSRVRANNYSQQEPTRQFSDSSSTGSPKKVDAQVKDIN